MKPSDFLPRRFAMPAGTCAKCPHYRPLRLKEEQLLRANRLALATDPGPQPMKRDETPHTPLPRWWRKGDTTA